MSEIVIVGVDEAGRGALAGPVVAGACVLPALKKFPVIIRDSKEMSSEEREVSFEWIKANCVYGVGSVEASEIDRIGILAATEIAMQQAVKQVSEHHKELYVLIDGRDAFWFDHPHSSIVRGDKHEKCIAAGSIIAKVTRDRRMIELHQTFPEYGFAKHKGYGTNEHLSALRMHDLSSLHRKTFLKEFTAATSRV